MYRLYVDESGTPDFKKKYKDDNRCLGLTGLIVEKTTYETSLQPGLKGLKMLFTDDPDDLPIFHQEEIIKKTGAFKKLKDFAFETIFNEAYLNFLTGLPFTICCTVIDKERHQGTYHDPAHPYHYCLEVMLERYVGFLQRVNSRGDVMAESRGAVEDTALKAEYTSFFENGTPYFRPPAIQERLSSREIKMKKKIDRIDGLELADLLAIPTKLDVLQTYGKLTVNGKFNRKIIETIQPKYYKSQVMGISKGYGKKLL